MERRKMKEINNDNNKKKGYNKVKSSSWDFVSEFNGSHEEADLLGIFSWPPRSYTCSFCKREFRSAQALGGHMNVHRRDRARLRQSPPSDNHHAQYSLLNLNVDPNPNNFSLTNAPNNFSLINANPLPSTKCPLISSLPSLIPPQVSTISTTSPVTVAEIRKKWGNNAGGVDQISHSCSVFNQDLVKSRANKRLFELHEKEGSFLKKGDIVRLELGIGLVGEAKEDLDLELRLGYST